MSISKITQASVSPYPPASLLESNLNSTPVSPMGINPSPVSPPTDSYPLPSNNKLTDPGDAINSDYVGIMGERAKLLQTAKKVDETTFSLTLIDVDVWKKKSTKQCPRGNMKGCPVPKTITQREYTVLTAEGETRYFFVKPERVLCEQDELVFNVHRHFTSVGKPVIVPDDYLTNPKYRCPSPIPDDTSESVKSEATPPPNDTSESVKSEATPPPNDTSESVKSEATPPPNDTSESVKQEATPLPLPVYIPKVVRREDAPPPIYKFVKRRVGYKKISCIFL